jgi:four helix bundle suffix protein
MELFDKCGGYRKLDSFVLSTIVQLATIRFCERFLNRKNDPCGRTFDQMTQAARSGRQNIVEGSERAATSKETEMKLTDVARASLGELRGDYEIWLLQKGLAPWPTSSEEAQAVFELRLDPPQLGKDVAHDSCTHILTQQRKFERWLDHEDDTVAANALLILISRTINMLNHQLQSQGESFVKAGGFRERMTACRLEERGKQEPEERVPACPLCGKPMRSRAVRSGPKEGQAFWGCTGYPACKGTREMPVE